MIYLYYFAAYLIGSIPFGLLIGRLKGVDLREHGSKNIGATNAFRVLGKKWGLLVFALDALKGYLAVALISGLNIDPPHSAFALGAGVAAILGHTFPIWLKFKGGKGVATSLGVFIAVCPIPATFAFAVWTLALLISRIISISSICAAVSFPVFIFLTYRQTDVFPWLMAVGLLLLAFIIFTHRANISRIIHNEEKKLF